MNNDKINLTRASMWEPTGHLRYVARKASVTFNTTPSIPDHVTVQVLQQEWVDKAALPYEYEWRDVPMEEE